MKNILTVDVEEWFHPEALQHLFPREKWDEQPARVEPLVERLLQVFAEHGARATFFVLGWVAQKHPQLVRRIVEQGHEVASHSFSHRMVTKMTPEEFEKDLKQSVKVLHDITGQAVLGFRAPTFSITKESFWAYRVLVNEGFEYDSSIYPIWHDRYGVPDAPRSAYWVEVENGRRILEFPMPTLRFGSKNFPFGGGGYLRIFPLLFTRRAIKKFNAEGQPAIVYMHPWEFDVDQPRVRLGKLQSIRHYANIGRNENKLRRLLKEFEWMSFKEYLLQVKSNPELPVKKLNL